MSYANKVCHNPEGLRIDRSKTWGEKKVEEEFASHYSCRTASKLLLKGLCWFGSVVIDTAVRDKTEGYIHWRSCSPVLDAPRQWLRREIRAGARNKTRNKNYCIWRTSFLHLLGLSPNNGYPCMEMDFIEFDTTSSRDQMRTRHQPRRHYPKWTLHATKAGPHTIIILKDFRLEPLAPIKLSKYFAVSGFGSRVA